MTYTEQDLTIDSEWLTESAESVNGYKRFLRNVIDRAGGKVE